MDTLVSVGSRVQGVAQQLVDTHLADVRPEVLKGLDARHMTAKETSITILGMAMAWLLLEGLLHVLFRPLLYRFFYPCGTPLHKKGRAEAAATVSAAVGKLVSLVHNAIQIPLALSVLLDSAVASDTIYGHTRASTLMCLISAGYFLYDLAVVLGRREGTAFLVHAAACLFVYTYAVYSFYLHYFGAGFLLWELSTPLVHARWFLLKSGQSKERLYMVNGLAMAAVFLACRPVWGTWLSYKFFQDTEVELRQPRPGGFPPSGIWGYRVSNVALNLLNYFWFAKIAAKALQMVAPRRKAKSRAGKIC